MAMAAPKEDFSSRDLARLSGLSAHMVNYLCRCEILRPSLSSERRHGIPLRFSFADVVLARAIGRLLAAGASVAALKRALATLRKQLQGLSPAALQNQRVVIVGNSVYLPGDGARPVDLTANGQIAFDFVLEADRIATGQPRPNTTTVIPRRTRRA